VRAADHGHHGGFPFRSLSQKPATRPFMNESRQEERLFLSQHGRKRDGKAR